MVKVKNGSTVEETYSYDGLDRRVTNTVGSTTTQMYYSTQGQVLEEAIGGNVSAQYVWSPISVNALILRDRATTTPGTLDERLWAVQDANWNVVALVDGSQNVVERYAYDQFGTAKVYAGDYSVRSGGTAYASVYGFRGMRLDPVTGQNLSHSSAENTILGVWTNPNFSAFAAHGNLYQLVGNDPADKADPAGLQEKRGGILQRI